MEQEKDMRRNWIGPVIVTVAMSICGLGSTRLAGADKPLSAPLGVRLADWTLPRSSDGRSWSLARDGRQAKVVVVVFLGTECPINNLYLPSLVTLHKKYAPRTVLFAGIARSAIGQARRLPSLCLRIRVPGHGRLRFARPSRSGACRRGTLIPPTAASATRAAYQILTVPCSWPG